MITKHTAAAALVLLGALAAPAQAQPRQAPPAPLPAREMVFPAFAETTLPNGMRMIVVENRALPVLDVDLYVSTGSAADPRGKRGVASMVASLLDKGTPTRTARQIAERIEGVGATISASADDDFVSVSANALSDQDTLVFSLLSDVVLRPTFPEEEFQTARTRTLSQLRSALGQPETLGNRALARTLYGAHPYGAYSEVSSVEAIRREDLSAFHAARFKPGSALLVVAGDITRARAEELARRHFGAWSGGAAPAVAMPAPPAPSPTRITLVHRPGSVQSNVLVGNLATRPNSPDVFALDVMGQVLGGGTDGRLFQILRQQKGWTYGAYASLVRPRDVGHFRAAASVRTEVTDSALAEMLAQVRRIRTETVSAAEFEGAKSYLLGSYPLRFETPAQIASRVAEARLQGLPVEQVRDYRRRIEAVTPADVQRVARRWLHPDSLVIVVVGDASKVLPGLQKIAPVSVVDVEGKPVDPASLQARASTERFDGSRLRPVALTYRMVFNGNPVSSTTNTLRRDGDAWVVTSSQAGAMSQQGELRFTAAGMEPLSLRQSMTAGPTQVEMNVTAEGRRMKGSAKLPAQMGGDKTFDAEVPPGTRIQGMEMWLLAVSDLSEGKTIAMPAFSPRSGSVANLTARVAGSESVTTPAGTFDTWKVEMTGGEVPFTMYVRKELPHVMVKQEYTGQPVVMELQSMQ